MLYQELPNVMKSESIIRYCDPDTKMQLLGDWVVQMVKPTIYLNKWVWINFTDSKEFHLYKII